MTKLVAYHNDPALRKSVINEMAAHRKADELVQGYGYWKDGKGCAVGCLIKGNDHALYETKFGIPEMLARLEDTIFEGLPKAKAKKWPERFLGAIKAGQDLSCVGWEFQHRLQINNLKFAKKQKFPDDVIKSIEMVIDVLEPMSKGKAVDESAARSAESAARSAARSAESAARSAESAAWSAWSAWAARSAWSAARSAAWSAWSAWAARSAWSAARSAESAARSAESAARSAARSAESAARSAESAESAAYEEMADLLIEIIKDGQK